MNSLRDGRGLRSCRGVNWGETHGGKSRGENKFNPRNRERNPYKPERGALWEEVVTRRACGGGGGKRVEPKRVSCRGREGKKENRKGETAESTNFPSEGGPVMR